jgi:integrase
VFALIRTGELASVRVGSSRRVTPEALAQYVDGLRGARDAGMPPPVTRLRRKRPAANGVLHEVLALPFEDKGGDAVTGAWEAHRREADMASINRRTTDSGEVRYDVRWRLGDGKVRNKTFRRRTDADVYRRRVEADELVGIVTDHRRGVETFNEIADRWLMSVPSKRKRSLERDEGILDCHLRPAFGSRRIQSITRADVQLLVDTLAMTLAPSSVLRTFSCLRAVFSFAERDEIVVRNPTRGTRLPRVSLTTRPVLDGDQVDRVARALGPDQAPMLWLGVVLGLRWGEAAGLTVRRIDFLRQTITVAAQRGRDLQLLPPKSDAGRRTLSAPAWLIDELAALLRREGVDGAHADRLVFTTAADRPWHYTSWRRDIWVPATKQAGLDGLRFHDLRSNAATALVAAGADIKTAQTRLGHANPAMTLAIYARATKEADRKAADAVGEMFRPRDQRAMERDAAESS